MNMMNNIQQGYKATSLGIIPQEWDVKKLGDIAQCFSGGTPKAGNNEYYDGNIPFIRSGEIHQKDTLLSLSEMGMLESSAKMVQKGDLLMALYGANSGDVAISQIDGAINQAILCIRPYNLLASFLCPFLELRKDVYVTKYLQGGQGNLSGEIVNNYLIPLPPLEEQRKIAEVLNVWDKAIEKQTQLIEKLELRKKGLMQQLLTGKKRLPGFSGEWKKVKLGTLFVERNEINRANLPLLSITADRGVIFQSESDKRDISNDDKSKYKRICPNDIGYNTMRMWQGRCALSSLEGIVSPAYTIITPNKDVNPHYMEMLFKQPFTMYCFWTHSQGLVSDTLNCKFPDFSQIKVTIPSLKEQNAISHLFMAINREIEIYTQRLNLFHQQKKGLMQILLTGKKRVR